MAGAYALAFSPLYKLVGEVVAVCTVIPVMMAGWLLGCRAGFFVGLVGIPLTSSPSRWRDRSGVSWCVEGGQWFS